MRVIRGINFLFLSAALAIIFLTILYWFDNSPPYVLGFLSADSNAYMVLFVQSFASTMKLQWHIAIIPLGVSVFPALWTHNFSYIFWGIVYSIPWGFILTCDHLIMS